MDEILEAVRKDIFEKMYPVGSLYVTLSDSTTCPIKQYIPNSTWRLVANNQCLQGTTTAANAGKEIEAAIPNIKGTIWGEAYPANSACVAVWDRVSGAFFRDESKGTGAGNGGLDWDNWCIGLDASRSSKIYKDNCKTVQPPALTVCVWKRTA